MRVLWISLLLIGSISCFPQQVREGGKPAWWYSTQSAYEDPEQSSGSVVYGGYPEQSSGSVVYGGYPEQSSGSVGYGGYPEQSSGSVVYGGYPEQSSGSVVYGGYPEQPSGSVVYGGSTSTAGGGSGSYGGQGVPQVGQYGSQGSSGPYQQVEESWSSSSDTSGEDEPVFTPVDDDDQVYAFKSRSRYNRKRLLFDQFRYTPTELRTLPEPVFPPHQPGKGHHHHQKGYVKI